MDRLSGMLLVAGGVMFTAYYSTWIVVLPFVDEENFLQQFFPSKALAVSIPLMMGVLGLIVIGIFACVKMRQKKSVSNLKAS
ncbi:dolichol phosphate-mannose biosynthesis regulatory protein-like [Crassostrea virginica]